MNEIVDKTRKHVEKLVEEKLDSKFHFHSIDHIRQTVDAVQEIGSNSGLDEQQLELLTISAWFHDVGYIHQYEGHEEEGARIAGTFLREHGYEEDKIEEVKRLILATKIAHKPVDLMEKVIRDADMIHLGQKKSLKQGQLLRQEWDDLLDRQYSDLEWLELDKKFYANAQFHTDYARGKYGERLDKNLQKIREQIEQEAVDGGIKAEKKKNKKLSKQKKELNAIKMPQRGVETVFRTTSRNHLRLSAIADNKANTLISISALIISIILTFLIDTLEVNPGMFLTTVIMLGTCVMTIIFATLSTKPKVTENTITRDDIKNRKGNLLFFGNFYKMKLEDYLWGMRELMHDGDYLYGNLMQDIYYLGLVLKKKYKFLSMAYSVFMYGIILSVVSFLLMMYVFTPE